MNHPIEEAIAKVRSQDILEKRGSASIPDADPLRSKRAEPAPWSSGARVQETWLYQGSLACRSGEG